MAIEPGEPRPVGGLGPTRPMEHRPAGGDPAWRSSGLEQGPSRGRLGPGGMTRGRPAQGAADPAQPGDIATGPAGTERIRPSRETLQPAQLGHRESGPAGRGLGPAGELVCRPSRVSRLFLPDLQCVGPASL
jgi:hypothetical protein